MKKAILHSLLLIAPVLFCAASLAQIAGYAATKEKIYVQTNHVFLQPGETLYFKLYVVNGKDQRPSQQSGMVYVEVINPSGNVLQKLQYRVEHGYAEGSFDFGAEAAGGMYKIRAYTTWMRNENSNFFVKEITLLKTIAPRILMKLDFPAKGYGAGDEVKALFSIRSLNDQPIKNHEADFTVSIGGTVAQTGTFKTDKEGKSLVLFRLPGTLKTSDGLLNITVRYGSYTEAIARSIPIVLNQVDLQLLPEGGTLVEGITTNIAFKALNENGKAADVKGEVWDDQGNKITAFESYHFGMGSFRFTPQKGHSYTAKIISPVGIARSYPLPTATARGVVMNISKADGRIRVKLTTTNAITVKLTAQTKGLTYYIKDCPLQKGEHTVVVEEGLFPIGIAQFTVYKADSLPLAERLVFLQENRHLQVHITTDKQQYLPREKITVSIKTTDENGRPLPSNLSLAVVDDKLWSLADDKQDDILSWLLMSTELKGKIEEPAFYFKKDEPKALTALDLVMLTHGYRYFDYTPYVLKEGVPAFRPDQQNMLSGVLLNGQDKPVKGTVFLLHAVPGGKAIRINTETDGLFFFSELASTTTYYLFAQGQDKKEKVTIRILQQGVGFNPLKVARLQPAAVKANEVVVPRRAALPAQAQQAVAEVVNRQEQLLEAAPLFKQAALQEVVVVGFDNQGKRDITGSIALLNAKELVPGVKVEFALQGKMAGIVVDNGAPGAAAKVMLRGTRTAAGTQPLYVLDGVPIELFQLNTLNPADIESITILKDATTTAVYGGRAANGVVVIETKKYRNEKIRIRLNNKYSYALQVVQTQEPVYSIARKFYAPAYYSLEAPERTDFRETIYWNPVVQTDKNGQAELTFYNSDASTTFRIIAEGIACNGWPGRTEHTYAVQNAITADAKIPPYLTVGDKALVPLVIKNNTLRPLQLSIRLRLPANLKAGDFTNTITLAPDSSGLINIPLEATAAVNGKVQFIVESPVNKEIISLPVAAAEKGFPVIQTFSGNTSGKHNFDINKMVPGSLQAHLKLFKNVEGQLLDGIESMLREPYGCFEQTSSCTYPNVYILKYLRESGKSNPAIEEKALAYIKRGYNRLMGFETAENGFEWFGQTPPHEALTAYGLLEFTDMQPFIQVDKQMLARTKNYLLNRRNGKGTFKLVSGGYDQFASVPDKVANTYIVYALTQAGVGKEIQQEYDTAVQQALQHKDGYQMAMMALAASNMNNKKDYDLLMHALSTYYGKSGLIAETSVVNSQGASLQVETLSLYALALMRSSSPDMSRVAELIAKILAEKSYYGYGSTQATVLALQAIVAYSKLTGRITENTNINFTMNDKGVSEEQNLLPGMQEGKNVFGVTYSGETNSIPYSLEVSYNTLTPPNNAAAALRLTTRLANSQARVGETVRMEVTVTNEKNSLQPMAIAKVGIPAGLGVQPWQLKEILEKNKVAYYELFDNYLVFYWMGFAANETKKINLDLKAEIAGMYKAKASNTYLYYTPEYRYWNEGVEVEIRP